MTSAYRPRLIQMTLFCTLFSVLLSMLSAPVTTAVLAAEIRQITAGNRPGVIHGVAEGWAESPALAVRGPDAFVAYEVTEGRASQIWLARIPIERAGGGTRPREVLGGSAGDSLLAKGIASEKIKLGTSRDVEAWPSLAIDRGDLRGSSTWLWVAWSACRDDRWAVWASRVESGDRMKVVSRDRISGPGGMQSQVRVKSEHGITCFVWVSWDAGRYSIMARIHDGRMGSPFVVQEGPDPVGRPDVHIAGPDSLVFVWDQYAGKRFAICRRASSAGRLGPVQFVEGLAGTTGEGAAQVAAEIAAGMEGAGARERANGWEPHIAGQGENYLIAWSAVPEGTWICEPRAAIRDRILLHPALGSGKSDETWRVRACRDTAGQTWLAWTTRFYYRSTEMFVQRIEPDGVSRICEIDFPVRKMFMNTFECEFDPNLLVAWDGSGSVYLAEIPLEQLMSSTGEPQGEETGGTGAPGARPGRFSSGPAAPGGEEGGEDMEAEGAGESFWAAERESANVVPKAEGSRSPARALEHSVFYEGESLHVYFGDYHNHSSFSDGRAYPDISLLIARDTRLLDFAGMNDHDVTLTPGEFDWTRSIASHLSKGRKVRPFAALYGFEASKGWASSDFGHWSVLFRRDGWVLHYRTGMTPPDLYRFAREEDGIVIPHHVAKRFALHDWNYADPVAEPAVEMCSVHGIFESRQGNEGRPDLVDGHFVQDGLARGLILGFVGGSDSHNCFEAAGVEYGLTGVYAPELTSDAIFDAISRRRTFALTGGRTVIDFRCNGRLMGEVIEAGRPGILVFAGHACSADSIVSAEIVSGGKTVYRNSDRAPEVTFSWEVASPDTQTYYYLKVATSNGDLAWSSPIWIVPRR